MLFLDTDEAEGAETRLADALQNPLEAALVMAVVGSLLASGLPASAIGITSPYRSQVPLAIPLRSPISPSSPPPGALSPVLLSRS